jgi:DNA polymerase-3 subunit alpha
MINYNFNSTMIQEGDDDGMQSEESEQNEFVSDIKDGMQIETGGIVAEVKKIMTKQGNKPMAILTVEDIYGEFDCMMFPKTFEKFGSTLEADRIVHINGKVSIRVGEKPIILIESISYLDEKKTENSTQNQETKTALMSEPEPQEEKVKKVYLQFDITNQVLVNTLNEIVSGYEGKSPVLVQYNKKLYPLGCYVEPSNALVSEISRVIGASNIKII